MSQSIGIENDDRLDFEALGVTKVCLTISNNLDVIATIDDPEPAGTIAVANLRSMVESAIVGTMDPDTAIKIAEGLRGLADDLLSNADAIARRDG